MKTSFKAIALVGKYQTPEVAGPLLELAEFLHKRRIKVYVDELTANQVKAVKYPALRLEEIGEWANLVIAIGGDGTMLNIARAIAPHNVPLVGVNQGRLGFLTDISTNTMIKTIAAMLEGKFVTESRMLLSSQVLREGQRIFEVLAFNDASVTKGGDGGLIELEVKIDGQFVYVLRGDGLIVSTPTGSTAYALSAGGPILHPALSALSIVPVCPHTLSNRPITIGSDAQIEILMHRCADARVHYDSHSHCELRPGDRIQVARYPRSIRLLHALGHNYYHMLREKLHWSEFL